MSAVSDVVSRFPSDVQEHVLTVMHDQGLYRHLRFAKPGTYTNSFHIVTWPGRLCFCGDMGTYVFERIEDMLEFFRHDSPNYDYWAEKCSAQDLDGVRKYSAELFTERVRELATDACSELDETTRAQVLLEVEDRILDRAEDEQDARQSLAEFNESGIEFEDTWELRFEEFTYRYVWCCNALVWAVKQYDARKAVRG